MVIFRSSSRNPWLVTVLNTDLEMDQYSSPIRHQVWTQIITFNINKTVATRVNIFSHLLSQFGPVYFAEHRQSYAFASRFTQTPLFLHGLREHGPSKVETN